MKYIVLTGMDSTQSIDLIGALGVLKVVVDYMSLSDYLGEKPTLHWSPSATGDGSFNPVIGVPDDFDLVDSIRDYLSTFPLKDCVSKWRFKKERLNEIFGEGTIAQPTLTDPPKKKSDTESSALGWFVSPPIFQYVLLDAIRRNDAGDKVAALEEQFIRSLVVENSTAMKRSLLFLVSGSTIQNNVLEFITLNTRGLEYNSKIKTWTHPKGPAKDWISEALFVGNRDFSATGDRLFLDDRSSNVLSAFSDGSPLKTKVKIGSEWFSMIALGSIPTYLNRARKQQTAGFERSGKSSSQSFVLATWDSPLTWRQVQRILTTRLLTLDPSERRALGILSVIEMKVDYGTQHIPGYLGKPIAR